MSDETRNYYADTDQRMAHDTEFRAAVHILMRMAEQSGFTPGELRQIAFRAAIELEMRRPMPPHIADMPARYPNGATKP